MKKSLAASLKERYGTVGFELMDITMIAYLGLLGLLVIPFHRGVSHWALYPAIHAGIIFAILEFLRFSQLRSNALIRFLRAFYPVLGISFFWMELDTLVTMILPYWANAFVIRLDVACFGVHPSVWVEQWFRPWLTELMNFFYAFYFLYIPIVGGTLYFSGRKREAFDFMFLVMLTFCSSFLLFLLFPAEGAWVVLKDLHHVQPKGGLFLHLNQFLQSKGTIRGGAFPSSHVAAAFVIALVAVRKIRRLGYFLLPLAFGVALATVYCRYHHAVDAIAGIVWGVVCYLVGTAILKHKGRTTEK